jgi:hypothetical protein
MEILNDLSNNIYLALGAIISVGSYVGVIIWDGLHGG